ncbi:hypothetical protein [Aegicerativicinus sediminis]
MNFAQIQERINRNIPLDFGEIFNNSIDLYKKSIVHGLVMQLLIFVLILPFLFIIYLPFVVALWTDPNNSTVDPSAYEDVMSSFSLIYVVFFFIGILVIATLSLLVHAGFFRILKRLDEGLESKMGELFYYFKNPYLGRAFVLVLAIILISVVAMLLFVLPLFFVMVPIALINVIFAFNIELGAGEIIKASFNLGTKKWLITFGLYFVCSILAAIVGFLLCGIGSIVTAPFAYHPLYFIYKKAVGFETENILK